MKDETQKASDFITPTIEQPTYVAENDYVGYIGGGRYKETQVTIGDCTSCFRTFATGLTDGIVALHEYIAENAEMLEAYPHAVWNLYAVNGTKDPKHDQARMDKVYSISTFRAQKYLSTLKPLYK